MFWKNKEYPPVIPLRHWEGFLSSLKSFVDEPIEIALVGGEPLMYKDIFDLIKVISGLGLFYPDLIFDRIFFISGVQFTAVTHSIFGFFISVFLFIHLYVASIGKHPLKNYKSMVSGYHEE